MMAGVAGRTFADQVRCVSTDKEWIDCSCLLALACFFHVDVVIFQAGVEPAMLGTSMMGANPYAVLSLAMVNDVHFWGLRPIRVAVPHVQPPNGDMIRVPLVDRNRCPSSDDEVDLHAWHQQVIEPARPQLADTTVEKEFDLCRCLMNWQPFAAPPSPLVDAIGRLTAEPLPYCGKGSLYFIRQPAEAFIIQPAKAFIIQPAKAFISSLQRLIVISSSSPVVVAVADVGIIVVCVFIMSRAVSDRFHHRHNRCLRRLRQLELRWCLFNVSSYSSLSLLFFAVSSLPLFSCFVSLVVSSSSYAAISAQLMN